MTRKLHPCARTNATLRREIQESSETNKALAARLGLNLKTVAKWRSRATTSDARKGPRPVSNGHLSGLQVVGCIVAISAVGDFVNARFISKRKNRGS